MREKVLVIDIATFRETIVSFVNIDADVREKIMTEVESSGRVLSLDSAEERAAKCADSVFVNSNFREHPFETHVFAYSQGCADQQIIEQEKSSFSKQDMLKFAMFNYKRQNEHPEFTTTDNFDDFISE